MLNEDGLLLLVVLGACALVVLGTLELLWPTRPRHPRRRPAPARDPLRRARAHTAPAPHVALPTVAPAVEVPAVEALKESPATDIVAAVPEPAAPDIVVEPPVAVAPVVDDPPPAPPVLRVVPSATTPPEGARRERRRRGTRSRPYLRPAPPVAPRPMAEAAPPPPEVATTAEPDSRAADAGASVIDRGFALLEAQRFSEVVTLGEEALEATKTGGLSAPTVAVAQERTRLWGVVGLAREGLDDLEGARFAFEEAIALAPGSARPTWERHLAALALKVGRRAVDGAGSGSSRPERVASLRSAIDWLERGLAVAPDDSDLRETLTAARGALWPTHEAILRTLVQRRQFAEARRILDEVMADPECPPERRGAFRRLLGRVMGGEAAHTTAEAASHMQAGRGEEAVAALARAQGVIAAIPVDALAVKRREELERRVWWGYMKLATSRVEAGAQEAALGPLFRALSLTAVGERGAETRGLLARALGELVEARAEEIGRLIDAGDTRGASAQSEKLSRLLRDAVARGVPEDDLANASGRVLALFDHMGAKRP